MFGFKYSFIPKNKLKDSIKKITIIEIVLIQICLFYCFIYGDIDATTNHGILLLDCIYEGKIRSFYDIAVQRYVPAYYDFAIYIIFAIWDFPLWVAQKSGFPGSPFGYIWGMLWAKTIVLFFAFVCLYYMWKILSLDGRYRKYDLLFLFSTDILITAGLCIMGQYDIITVSFVMAGLYYYLKGDNKKFILAFAIAIPIKAFAFLLFCPLLVQREKKLPRIIFNIILVVIPIILLRLAVPMSVKQNQMIVLYLGKFLDNFFVVSNGRISIFVVSYLILLVYCYVHTFKDILYSSIVTAAFVFAIFLLFSNPYPQWWVYVAPFIVLLVLLNNGSNVAQQMLSIIGEFAILLQLIRGYFWAFSPVNLQWGLLKYVIPIDPSYVNGPANMFNAFSLKTTINEVYILEIATSIGFVCLGFFLFLCTKRNLITSKLINSQNNVVFVSCLRPLLVIFAYALIFLQLKYV